MEKLSLFKLWRHNHKVTQIYTYFSGQLSCRKLMQLGRHFQRTRMTELGNLSVHNITVLYKKLGKLAYEKLHIIPNIPNFTSQLTVSKGNFSSWHP